MRGLDLMRAAVLEKLNSAKLLQDVEIFIEYHVKIAFLTEVRPTWHDLYNAKFIVGRVFIKRTFWVMVAICMFYRCTPNTYPQSKRPEEFSWSFGRPTLRHATCGACAD